jgi:hypothetical protein
MLRGVGQPFEIHEVDRGVMMRSIEVLRGVEEARSTATSNLSVHRPRNLS